MIAKTSAIALRTFPYSETSLVVAWLTRGTGRLMTMVKGALRPKSAFIGHIDLFYTCEILFYDRDQRDLVILRECSPEKTRRGFRTNWRSCVLASYMADLLYRAGPTRAHQPGLFDFLDASLDLIHEQPPTVELLLWLELKVLAQLGMAPRLQHCTSCHRRLSETTRLDLPSGGGVCPHCPTGPSHSSLPVSPDVLALLSAWQRYTTPTAVHRTRPSKPQLRRMAQLLGAFVEHHMERSSVPRAIALDLLRIPL